MIMSPQIGAKLGRLQVIGEPTHRPLAKPDRNHKHEIHIPCRCSCGTEKLIHLYRLTKGITVSCGCLNHDAKVKASTRHGDTAQGRLATLYVRWMGIKGRCECPTNSSFAAYGGRGIRVCEEWSRSYATFKEWSLANGFQPCLHLDRINNNGPYSPENCRWVAPKKNMRNRPDNVLLTVFGETKSVAARAEDSRCPVSRYTLYDRLRYGWMHEAAVTIPLRRSLKNDPDRR